MIQWIKRSIKLFALPIVVISLMLILLIYNQRKVPGTLIFENNLIEFSRVPEWEGPVTKSIKAWNRGEEKVVIQRVEANCGYIKIDGPEEIEPGKDANFDVSLNPESVQSDESSGIVIFTDSPRTPRLYLTIAHTIERFAELSAEVCDFGEIAPNSVYEKKIRLRVNAPMEMDEIRLAESSSPALKWFMEEGDSMERFVKLKLGPVRDRGIFSSVLTVIFPNERTIALPVAAKVVGHVKAHPESIFYGTVARGSESAAEFVLKSESAFNVLQVHTPKDLVIEDIPEGTAQNSFAIKVRWHPAYDHQILKEEIQVLTDLDPEMIRIPVYGIVQERK